MNKTIQFLEKTIELKNNHGGFDCEWKTKIKLAKFPDNLRINLCEGFFCKGFEKKERELILATQVIENNWGEKNDEDFRHECFGCANETIKNFKKWSSQNLEDVEKILKDCEQGRIERQKIAWQQANQKNNG